jgi:hypothetical protein
MKSETPFSLLAPVQIKQTQSHENYTQTKQHRKATTMKTTRTPAFTKASAGRQTLIAAALACARERNSYNRLPR